MRSGLIEGEEARKYAEEVESRQKSALFNAFILKNINLNKKLKIADFCCGSGNTLELLRGKVQELVGVDGSKEMIKICQEKFNRDHSIKLKLSSAAKTNLPSLYFDGVIIRMGLHHLKEKEQVLEEVYRVLKPKGKVIVIDEFYLHPFQYCLVNLSRLLKLDFHIFKHFVKSKEENLRLLSRRFKIIKKRYLSYYPPHGVKTFMFVLEKI